MSALMLAVKRPRAALVALHGGAVTSASNDSRRPPGSSLLITGAALGYTVIAIDRPGYGASAGYSGRVSNPDHHVDLVYGAIDALLADHPADAGMFVIGHSMGCVLSVRLAADPRGAGLLGLEIAGTGLVPHPEDLFMGTLTGVVGAPSAPVRRPGRSALKEALWNPARLYPPGAATTLGYAVAPAYEGAQARGWVGAFPALAAAVRVPVHYTLGDHERVWSNSPAALAQVAVGVRSALAGVRAARVGVRAARVDDLAGAPVASEASC